MLLLTIRFTGFLFLALPSRSWLMSQGTPAFRFARPNSEATVRYSSEVSKDDSVDATTSAWELDSEDGGGSWKGVAVNAPDTPPSAAAETLRWCRNFVLPLNLCPWAAASVQARGAIQIYSVANQEEMEGVVFDLAQLFHDSVVNERVDPSVAISFLICKDRSWSFADFYDWFCELEEEYWDDDDDLQSKVTLAPFHPDWEFEGGDEMPALRFEKKSPYPTVTLVWAPIVEAAGEAVTSKIADQNCETLGKMTVEELNELYESAVYLRQSR